MYIVPRTSYPAASFQQPPRRDGGDRRSRCRRTGADPGWLIDTDPPKSYKAFSLCRYMRIHSTLVASRFSSWSLSPILPTARLPIVNMGRRAASPAPSDAEADIFDSLYTEDIETVKPSTKAADEGFDFLNVGGQDGAGEDDDDGDEAFIALKQAASYRKTSQMKSKSLKKSGGGFQTMGMKRQPSLAFSDRWTLLTSIYSQD